MATAKEKALITGLTAVVGGGRLKAQHGAVHRFDWWRNMGHHRPGHVVFRSDVSESSEDYEADEAADEPEGECGGGDGHPLQDELAAERPPPNAPMEDTVEALRAQLIQRDKDNLAQLEKEIFEDTEAPVITAPAEEGGTPASASTAPWQPPLPEEATERAAHVAVGTAGPKTAEASGESVPKATGEIGVVQRSLMTAVKTGRAFKPAPRLIAPRIKAGSVPAPPPKAPACAAAGEAAVASAAERVLRPLPRPLPKGSAAALLAHAAAAAAAATRAVAAAHQPGGKGSSENVAPPPGEVRPTLPPPPPPPAWMMGAAADSDDSDVEVRYQAWPKGSAT